MLNTADKGRINPDIARQLFTFGADHRYPKPLQDHPSHSESRAQCTFKVFY